MTRLNKNIKIFLNYILGPLLFIWLSVSIYRQIRSQPGLEDAVSGVRQAFQHGEGWKIWTVLLCMALNWGVEARKFQVLLSPLEKIGIGKAFRAILSGIAFSISTPNRVGEYPGKVLLVQEGNRLRALSLIAAGNFSQLIVTLFTGTGGLFFLIYSKDSATSALHARSYFQWIPVGLLAVGLTALTALLTYFRLGSVIDLFGKVSWLRKATTYMEVVKEMTGKTLLQVFGLSCLRYGIFALQYILLLQLMQVDVTAWQAFWLICIIFLILSIVPTIAFAELGIRGQISLELFGLYSVNRFGIIAASVGIWVINLLIPAVIGSLLVLRIKIFSSK